MMALERLQQYCETAWWGTQNMGFYNQMMDSSSSEPDVHHLAKGVLILWISQFMKRGS
jgi:hypothetical protein